MRAVVLLGLILFLASCESGTEVVRIGPVIVVDAHGAPIKGALVMPENEGDRLYDSSDTTREQLVERTSDSQGLIHANLGLYYWPSDGCFHFVVTREGYNDTTFSISKDLFPSPLRITMDAAGTAGKSKPAPTTSASPAR